MKKYFKVIIILSLGINTISSCSSFLEENPEDRYVTDNFYQNENDAKAGVAAIYQQLYSIYDRNMFLLNALTTDDEKNGLGMPNQFLQNIEYLRFTSENSFVASMWQNNYSGISRANTAILKIPDVTMDENLKNRLIGEAKFLRALYYFNLVRFFGDVPLILNLQTVEDSYLPRSPKEEIYQQIIADLQDAEAKLPVTYGDSDIGRASKGAAKILLGKVYLTMHQYQNSADKLGEVVNNEGDYGYGLNTEFGDNWKSATEDGKEMVFTIEYMGPPGHGNNLMTLCAPKYSMEGGFAVLGLSNGNEADIPTLDLYSQFSDEDERKAVTLRTDFVSLIDGSVHTSSIPLFVKYYEEGQSNPGQSGNNIHILRYSDALLMYAEALNEVGNIELATQQINRVRERAFNDIDHDYAGLSQDILRKDIWKERRLELAYEGHRWFDLVRTGRFISRMKEHSQIEADLAEDNKVEIGQNIQDYMVLMPIPQREIDLNSQLTQNPGY